MVLHGEVQGHGLHSTRQLDAGRVVGTVGRCATALRAVSPSVVFAQKLFISLDCC